MPNETIQKILDFIQKETTQNAYSVVVETDAPTGIFDSKFSGLPYWDDTKAYPKDQQGNPMLLLAQFNFDKDKVTEPLPTKGMLQFFIANDEDFGLWKDEFAVVYHETIDTTITEQKLAEMGITFCADDLEMFPVCEPCGVRITPQTVSMNMSDTRFSSIFQKAVKAVLPEQSIPCSPEDLFEEDFDYFYDNLFDTTGHWLLGYPFFTQFDPRGDNDDVEHIEEPDIFYDTLLFQMDSDDNIIWGDVGVANFFINKKDLENKNFDDILYSWDCC